jgi:GntR family transcriptional repressor for pyruvate dehydrogenase complex
MIIEGSLEQNTDFEKVERRPLHESIVEQFESRIFSSELPVGSKLPSESEIGEIFGVSRTVVREAMQTLKRRGLIEISPGRGTFVRFNAKKTLKNSLNSVLQIGSLKTRDDLMEVREIIEPGMAMVAALRIKEEHIEELRKAIAIMDESMSNSEAYIQADNEFHLTLAKATQNSLLPILIDSIVDLLTEQRERIFLAEGGPQQGQKYHKKIYQAILDKDPDAAFNAMVDHLRQVRESGHHHDEDVG